MVNHKLQVFISYVTDDIHVVRGVYNQLKKLEGVEPWFAIDCIKPGDDWEKTIAEKIKRADCFVVCWSEKANNERYIQKELKSIEKRIELKPEDGPSFLYTLRLEDVAVPILLQKYQWVDYFGNGRFKALKRIINVIVDKAHVKIEKLQEIKYIEENELSYNKQNNSHDSTKEKATPKTITISRNEVAKAGYTTLQHFVDRISERRRILNLLNKPFGTKRVAYLIGRDGIGKSQLIIKVLSSQISHPNNQYLIPFDEKTHTPKLIDFYSTDTRTVDGLRETIIQHLGGDHFLEFRQPKHDTPSVFRNCLQELVKQKPVILAFDTFELVHNDPLVNWLLGDNETGLQTPGLICLIGSRPSIDKTSRIERVLENNSLVEKIELPGLLYKDAVELYCRMTGLDAGWLNPEQKNYIKTLVAKTDGNPSIIELMLDQLR